MSVWNKPLFAACAVTASLAHAGLLGGGVTGGVGLGGQASVETPRPALRQVESRAGAAVEATKQKAQDAREGAQERAARTGAGASGSAQGSGAAQAQVSRPQRSLSVGVEAGVEGSAQTQR